MKNFKCNPLHTMTKKIKRNKYIVHTFLPAWFHQKIQGPLLCTLKATLKCNQSRNLIFFASRTSEDAPPCYVFVRGHILFNNPHKDVLDGHHNSLGNSKKRGWGVVGAAVLGEGW